jgi:enoyl-CoA hydratase/carnithine racemase
VIVLSGAGDKAFVAGADISRFADERASAEAIEDYGRKTASASEALYASAKPTIAQIRGFCIGGGVGIAGCCDLRIAAEDAQFAIPAARLGLGYAYDNMSKLVALVGPASAKELFFTARRFKADEALAMGLLNRVVPVEKLQSTVDEYTDMIGDNAPLTVAAAKRTIGEVIKDPDKRDLAACERMVQACFDSEDYVEGRTAFMEKRKAAFKGR